MEKELTGYTDAHGKQIKEDDTVLVYFTRLRAFEAKIKKIGSEWVAEAEGGAFMLLSARKYIELLIK